MSQLLVSVCSITYNHAPYIRQCLDGFLMQQCNFAFEVLIHDDASTDGTQEIIKEYQEKYPEIIKPIFQTENQYSKGERGFNARFNYTRAKGKYIALCEGDDYWTDPLKLQKQVDFLEVNEDYGACFTNAIIDNKIDYEKIEYNTNYNLKEGFVPNELIFKFGGGIYPTATLLFRKSLMHKFNLSVKTAAGDELLIYSICNFSKVYFLNQKTAIYNRWEGGIFSGIKKNIPALIQYRKKQIKSYEEVLKFLKPQNRILLKKNRRLKVIFILSNSNFKLEYLKYIPYIGFRTFLRLYKII